MNYNVYFLTGCYEDFTIDETTFLRAEVASLQKQLADIIAKSQEMPVLPQKQQEMSVLPQKQQEQSVLQTQQKQPAYPQASSSHARETREPLQDLSISSYKVVVNPQAFEQKKEKHNLQRKYI